MVTSRIEDRPFTAIVMVLGAMFVFVSTDGMAKYLTDTLSAQQIVWIRYTIILLLILPVVCRRISGLRTQRPILHLFRGLALTGASIFFVFSLETLPLELATAIGFVAPLYVTVLSIVFLKEKVGIRRWAAVGFGFIGVLIIVRPGTTAFQSTMLFPLVSALCWASGLIITRFMKGSELPLVILFYSSLVGCVASAPLVFPVWIEPTNSQWILLISLGVLNAVGQYLIIRAFLLASASLLAPFSYFSIVWATLIGAVVFGTFPDIATVVGTSVLIGAGLYVWHRERVRAGVTSYRR